MIKVTDQAIDVGAALSSLKTEGAGSVVFHVGVVKSNPEGGRSEGISFTPQAGFEDELRAIEDDLRSKFELVDVVLIRRMGTLQVGDFILVAAVSASGREAAFGACREAIERYKKMKRLVKKELFVD